MEQNLIVVLKKAVEPTPTPTPTPEHNPEPTIPVPNTGSFTNTTISNIASGASILFMLAFIICFVIYYAKKNNLAKLLAKIFTITAITTFILSGALQTGVNADNGNNELSFEDFTLEVELNTNTEDTFTYGKSEIKVKEPTSYGYTLTAYTTTPDLLHTEDNLQKINTLNNPDITNPTILNTNTWGFTNTQPQDITNPVWNSLPSLQTEAIVLKDTDSATEANDTTELYFGVDVNDTLEEGSYKGKVTYNLTIKPEPEPAALTLAESYRIAGKQKLNGYYKLQDMNSDICDATMVIGEESQMQAIDTRDNKIYWITKLADGKCWFTQNLDHDIDKDFVYTPQDTDIPANWTPDKSTYQTGDSTWDDSYPDGYNVQQSYNPGDKIWDGVPTSSWGVTLDNMSQGANTHYHVGNYYSWSAAVAMNDTSEFRVNHQNADQSICPAGWTLPNGGNNTGIGSYQYLLEQYDWNSDTYEIESYRMWEAPAYFSFAGTWAGRSQGISVRVSLSASAIYNKYIVYGFDAEVDYYGVVGYRPNILLETEAGSAIRCVSR